MLREELGSLEHCLGTIVACKQTISNKINLFIPMDDLPGKMNFKNSSRHKQMTKPDILLDWVWQSIKKIKQVVLEL